MSSRCLNYAIGATIGVGSMLTATHLTTRQAQFTSTTAYNMWFMPPSLYVRMSRNGMHMYITNTVRRGVIADPLHYTRVGVEWADSNTRVYVDNVSSYSYRTEYSRMYRSNDLEADD